MGLIVGTWPELIEQARSAYLISPQTSDWKARFHSALEKLPDIFWSNSFEVSLDGTTSEMEAALSLLVGETDLCSDIILSKDVNSRFLEA